MISNKPKISIITVVYNGENVLARTIESVKNQTYNNIEYIVIDGASKDHTPDIIKENASFISSWISEKDDGLYDAMNKGLDMASGDYVLYLNAGDTFFDDHVVETVFHTTEEVYADIYYGETIMVDDQGNSLGFRRLRTPKKLSWKSFRMGMVVCHQSVFIRKDLTDSFCLKYRYAADYEWVLSALKKAKVIRNSHLIISKFEVGGYSSQHMKQSNIDRFKIMKTYYGLITTLFFHGVMLFRLGYTYIKTGRMQ